jgi:hypothetical protein
MWPTRDVCTETEVGPVGAWQHRAGVPSADRVQNYAEFLHLVQAGAILRWVVQHQRGNAAVH